MIALTRLGQHDHFFLNPDLIERIDCHVDTVVRLTNGVEYVVVESGDEIVERIVNYRASIVGRGPTVTRPVLAELDDDAPAGTVVELPTNRKSKNTNENEVPR